MAHKKHVRRKYKTALDERYKLQAYIEQEHKELIERALEIEGEGSLSGFAARVMLREARRIIAEHEEKTAPKSRPS